MNILIMKVQTIGDTLLIEPLISNLFLNFSKPKITLLLNEGTKEVLENHPGISKIIEYKRESQRDLSRISRFIKSLKLLQELRQFNFDVVIDLDEGDRGALITKTLRARISIGSSKISSRFLRSAYTNFIPDNRQHTVLRNLSPLKILGLLNISKKLKIYWKKQDEEFIRSNFSFEKNFVHIHPFSRGFFKDIEKDLLIDIINYCYEKLDLEVLVTLSYNQREIEVKNYIEKHCANKIHFNNFRLSLPQIACLNKSAKFFIGSDTAIMHISAANSVPVIAFFGPTSPVVWGPWDNENEGNGYVDGLGIQKNGIHTVISNINYNCLPCQKNGCNNSLSSECLEKLDFEVIKKQLDLFK